MESRQAAIMGASSGMGHRIAEILLEKGWRLGVAARREEMLLPLKEKYPGKVVTACIDVNDPKADELLLKMVEQMNGVDLYFHVSGIGKQNLTLEQDIEMNTVETNGTGFTRCITTMFNYMAKTRSRSFLQCHESFPELLSGSLGATSLHAPPQYPYHGHTSRIRGHTVAR